MDDKIDSVQRSVSRLPDGSILVIEVDSTDAFIYRDGVWDWAEGITIDEVTDSQPLTDAEIADLRAEGILPD